MEDPLSSRIRSAVFNWLDIQAPLNNYVLDWKLLSKGFQFENNTIPLIGAKGIWKPAKMSLPISIASVENSEYDDQFIDHESLYYRYRGADRNHIDNIGLRS